MKPIQSWLLVAFAGIIALSVGVLCWRLDLAVNKWGNSAPGDLSKTAQTITDADNGILDSTAAMRDLTIALLQPCPNPKKPCTLGLIPQLRQIALPAITAVNSLNTAAGNLGDAATALKGTADAGTKAATAATGAIGTAQTTIAAAQPVLTGATKVEGNINAYIEGDMIQKTIPSIAAHLDAGIVTGDAIATDVHVASHPFLNPDPCKTRKCKFGRYVWPVIKTGLGLGSDVNGWERAAGKPLKVKTQ
jgi:hypothetical protein